MKLGQVEGSPEEIKNFFQDNGLKASDYMQLPEEPLKPIWFIIPTSLITLAIMILTLFTPPTVGSTTLVFLLGCGASLWLAVNVQLRHKSWVATVLVALGCVLLLLVAIGAVAPREMMDEIRRWKE